MEIVLLGLIPLVLLAGIVLFAVGNRGWNWGTITAAFLVLLAATGYTFLIGMLAQRERGWREIVSGYQSALARERDALVPGGDGKLVPDRNRRSLATLASERARWQRVRDRVESWRGRHWPRASFDPPTVGPDNSPKAGRLTIEDVEKLTINEGAELYLFDAAPIEENGRFLGAFSVEGVNGNVLSILPALPPTAADVALWQKPREEVAVYEDLPVDRWLAFHRTATAEAEGGEPGAAHEHRKLDPEEMLKDLEHRLEDVRQHGTEVPEEEWPRISAGLASGEILPGTYWATVEFKESHELPHPRGEPEAFAAGRRATFDFETASKLAADGTAAIVSVERRRRLADGQTALRGSDYRRPGAADAEAPIRIEGVAFIRRMLESDIASIAAMTKRLQSARQSAATQLQLHAEEGRDLAADRDQWRADVDAAGRLVERFEARLEEAGTELAAVETDIVELGRELAGAASLLGTAIDSRAPPPARRPAAGP